MAPKYIFNYFESAGRGESIRLMFHAAGAEFTDNRMTKEEWVANKSDAKRFPLAQMPTLQVDDRVIIQSHAIGRYVARELGFYGSNTCEQATIDQITETLGDLAGDGVQIMFGGFDEETKKTKFAEFFASAKTKACLGFICNFLKNRTGGFFIGEKVSYADFVLYNVNLMMSQINPAFLDEYTEMKSLLERVENLEGVKKYLDSRKK